MLHGRFFFDGRVSAGLRVQDTLADHWLRTCPDISSAFPNPKREFWSCAIRQSGKSTGRKHRELS